MTMKVLMLLRDESEVFLGSDHSAGRVDNDNLQSQDTLRPPTYCFSIVEGIPRKIAYYSY